jgi:RimJ/RimL family protein N-acetyltransferase
MLWCHRDYSLADCVDFIAKAALAWQQGDHYSFAIFDAAERTFLGSVGLSAINPMHRVGNLGYWVRTAWTNRGVATAAVKLAAQFSFRKLGLQRLELLVPIENHRSLHVARRAGATQEGILRNRLLLHGRRHDTAIFSLIPRDLDAEASQSAPPRPVVAEMAP